MRPAELLPHISHHRLNEIRPEGLRSAIANAPNGVEDFLYEREMLTDRITEDGLAKFHSRCMSLLGRESMRVPLDVAWRMYELDERDTDLGHAFSTLMERMRTRDRNKEAELAEAEQRDGAGRRILHSILCRRLFDLEASPDWYVEELASIDLAAETSLRVLELRHSARELTLLETSSKNSARASWAALAVALISAGASVWAGAEAHDAQSRAQKMEISKPVTVAVDRG